MSEFPEIQGYKILKELGKGGMARVYLAFEEKLEREVALKILLKSLTEEKNLTTRFLKEAKTAAGLRHTNIVPVFDVGRQGEYYYFTMEHFEEDLKDKIVNNKIAPELALSIVKSIASALDYAHKKGFIHRDIKPDNIMFREDGTPVLVDFGIARALGSTTKLTKTGMSIGTPHYMSPEQARGKVLDGRSDIYSLGVVFYEMLTGKVPYEAEDSDSIAIAIKHIQEPIPELRSAMNVGAGLASAQIEKLQNIINKMMAKDPDERPQTGRDVIELISADSPQPSAFRSQPSEEINRENTLDKDSYPKLNKEHSKTIIVDTKAQNYKKEKIEKNSSENLDPNKNVDSIPDGEWYNNQNRYETDNDNSSRDFKREKENLKWNSKNENNTAKIVLLITLLFFVSVMLINYLNTQAHNRKVEAEQNAWNQALRWDTNYGYDNYINKYPNGKHIYTARNKKNAIREKLAKEERLKKKREQQRLARLKREEEARKERERIAAAKKERERLAKLRANENNNRNINNSPISRFSKLRVIKNIHDYFYKTFENAYKEIPSNISSLHELTDAQKRIIRLRNIIDFSSLTKYLYIICPKRRFLVSPATKDHKAIYRFEPMTYSCKRVYEEKIRDRYYIVLYKK